MLEVLNGSPFIKDVKIETYTKITSSDRIIDWPLQQGSTYSTTANLRRMTKMGMILLVREVSLHPAIMNCISLLIFSPFPNIMIREMR